MMTSQEIAARTFAPDMAANELAGRFLNAAHEATQRAEGLREELMKNIEWLALDLDHALTALRKGRTVNSLGICQGKAAEIDRQCGELHVASEIAGRVQFEAQRAGLLPK